MEFFDYVAFLVGFGCIAASAGTMVWNWRLRSYCRVLIDDSRKGEEMLRVAAKEIAKRDATIASLRGAVGVAMSRRGVSRLVLRESQIATEEIK